MCPHFDKTKSSQFLGMRKHIEEQTFGFVCAGSPDRSVGCFPFLDVLRDDGEGYQEGELFKHVERLVMIDNSKVEYRHEPGYNMKDKSSKE